jgi:hypothetical protein
MVDARGVLKDPQAQRRRHGDGILNSFPALLRNHSLHRVPVTPHTG